MSAMPPGTLEYRPTPEPEPPVHSGLSPWAWARENLFSNWYNTLLTLVFAPLIFWSVYSAYRFTFVTGRWRIVEVNLTSLMVGLFPRGELWRVWVALFILGIVVGLGLGVTARATRETAIAKGIEIGTPWHEPLRRAGPGIALFAVMIVFVRTATPLVLAGGLVGLGAATYHLGKRIASAHRKWMNLAVLVGLGGAYLAIVGFDGVPMRAWGGLMLTMYFAIGGIVLSFPLGVLLALGRRSSLPVVRWVCVVYIELIRGVPLITLLFMGWLVLGFFLPPGFPVPNVVQRALIAFVLFTAAYVAEIVRGGLQSVPRGQIEAGVAVGLSPWKVTRLIVLPQALRNVIPALVGQFISLFKDTTLVIIIGQHDLLGIARRVTQQPEFLGQGLHAETLVFVSFIYWVGSYWMSRESQRLEARLGVGER
jgi:general L-amino acid transport system permease protein